MIGPGEGGAQMTGEVAGRSMTVAGRREYARAVRQFIRGVLGAGHPCADDAVLLVSELSGNSMRHSRSGEPGGTVTVTVASDGRVVQVEVTDHSGGWGPAAGTC